jgi:hypothetical protein
MNARYIQLPSCDLDLAGAGAMAVVELQTDAMAGSFVHQDTVKSGHVG